MTDNARVATLTPSTGSHTRPIAPSVELCTSAPMTTPSTACAAVIAQRGTAPGLCPERANPMPTTSAATKAEEGTPTASAAAIAAAVTAASTPQRRSAGAIRVDGSGPASAAPGFD